MKLFVAITAFAFGLVTNAHAAAVAHKLDVNTSIVKWIGTKVAGSHNGTVNFKGGEVTIAGDKVTGGTFTLDLTTIKDLDLTDAGYNKKLTDHLKSADFFNVEKFPTGTVKVTKVTYGKGNDVTVAGELTIKDITKPVSFPATLTKDGKSFAAKGKFKINRLDWEIKYNSGKFFDPKKLGDKMINDEIEIEIDLKTAGA